MEKQKTADIVLCFEIVNSFLLAVCCLFLLEPMIMASRLQPVLSSSGTVLISHAVIMGIRVLLYSGIYGSLLLLASGEEWTLSLRKFFAASRQSWKCYLAVMSVPMVIHFLWFVLTGGKTLLLKQILIVVDPGISYLLSGLLIRKFYGPFLSKPSRPCPFDPERFCLLLAVCCFGGVLDLVALSWPGLSSGAASCLVFGARYLHLTVFVLFLQDRLKEYPGITQKWTSGKELVLIHPMGGHLLTNLIWSVFFRTPPAAFTVLLAQTPPEYRVRILNRQFFRNRFVRGGELVAITCLSANCADAYKIAKQYKDCGSQVIMGGPHVSALPEEAGAFCDSVVVGFSEGLWPKIIRDYEKGGLQPVYEQELTPAAFGAVVSDLLGMPAEMLRNCVEMTRGCKFRCEFCSIPGMSPFGIMRRPVEQALRLLKKFEGQKSCVVFQDNNIYSDPSYAKDLFRKMAPLKVPWTTFSSLDIAKDNEALALAKESGCVKLEFGYEIPPGSDEARRERKLRLSSQYLELTRKVQQAGIAVRGHFTFGFDGDSWQSFWRIARTAFELNLYACAVGILTPFPGSALYRRMLDERRILNANWNNYDAMHLVIQHDRLKPIFVVSHVFRFCAGLYFLVCCRKGQAILLLIVFMGLFLSLV